MCLLNKNYAVVSRHWVALFQHQELNCGAVLPGKLYANVCTVCGLDDGFLRMGPQYFPEEVKEWLLKVLESWHWYTTGFINSIWSLMAVQML